MQVSNHRTKREYFDSPIPAYQSNDIQTNDSEIEFKTHHHIADHCLGSPPRWTRRGSRSTRASFASFPLKHAHSSPSSMKQLQVINESRKSLMRMVEDMPEATYELSLRDMVSDQRKVEEVPQGAGKEEMDGKYESESKGTKRQVKNKGQVSRLDSGVSQLKMLIPRGSKTDTKEKIRPKASPKASPERGEKQNGLWRSTSDISWNKQRPFTSYFRVASWSSNRKPRTKGCLF